jgi:hypothetical protein
MDFFILQLQKKLAEDASEALGEIHGTYFDPINSADLCE